LGRRIARPQDGWTALGRFPKSSREIGACDVRRRDVKFSSALEAPQREPVEVDDEAGWGGRIRTYALAVNDRLLYR
jgi:hypothetical protein